MRWVIIGTGFTGKRLASRLANHGHRVVACGRDAPQVEDSRVATRGADPTKPETLAGVLERSDVVVYSVPPTAGDVAAEVNLVAAATAAGTRRLVYLSSTGVYPAGEGDWIDEDSPVGPAAGGRGVARYQAERAFMDGAANAGLEAVALRIAGIYGPGRGVQARLAAGTFRVIGAGETPVNRIHVDDLCAVIEAAGTVCPLPRSVYLVSDDAPTSSREIGDAVAQMMGLPPPPAIPTADVPAHVRAMLGANRRVRNSRMKAELGVVLQYPTWREGIAACLDES